MLIFRFFLKLHCEQRRTCLVIAGRLIFSRKSRWSENVRITSIPAPAVCYLIIFRIFGMAGYHFLNRFPGIAVTETHAWAAAHRDHVSWCKDPRSKHSPDHRSSHFPPPSSLGSIVVSSGMKVFVCVLNVGLLHIPVGSPHVSRSCKDHVVNVRKCNYDLIHSDKCHKGQAADLEQTPLWNCPIGHSLPQGEPEQSLPEASSLLQMSWKNNKIVACTCFFLEMLKKYVGNYILPTFYSGWKSQLQFSLFVQSWSLELFIGCLSGESWTFLYIWCCARIRSCHKNQQNTARWFPVWENVMFASALSEL